MAPSGYLLGSRNVFSASTASSEYYQQWTHPGDVFSILLILGGDVVARAVAQVASRNISSVTFSFGWVAYSINMLVAAIGDNRLMPAPDCACKVINGKTGYVRDNASWVIGRLVRDYDKWVDPKVPLHLEDMLNKSWDIQKAAAETKSPGSGVLIGRPLQAGLCVAIYEALPARPCKPELDFVHYSGFGVSIIQLGIAAIPCGLLGDWGVLLITASGILLSFLSSSLPQLANEKWACRRNSQKTVILTRGNGSQHVIVIRSTSRKGLDLEDLAAGPINIDVTAHWRTRIAAVGLAILWIMLLITAAGTKSSTWFLLAVGGIGMLHNIFVAGRKREPKAFGLPLRFEEVIGKPKVMSTLFAVEEKYPHLGKSMLDMFFPGGKLTQAEESEWTRLETAAKIAKHAITSAREPDLSKEAVSIDQPVS